MLLQDDLRSLARRTWANKTSGYCHVPLYLTPYGSSHTIANRDDPRRAFESLDLNGLGPGWWIRTSLKEWASQNVNKQDFISKQPSFFRCELSFLNLFNREMKTKEKSTPTKLFVLQHQCVLVLNCHSLWRLSKVFHFLINTIP